MSDDLRFRPDYLQIKAGDSIIWHNVSKVAHSVTADPAKTEDSTRVKLPEGAEAWDSGMVPPGRSWSRMFEVPGEYRYVCGFHEQAGMAGRIEVTE